MTTKTIKEKIIQVLAKDERLWNEAKDDLNQTLLLDLVEKIDEKIIGLLLEEESLREKFFVKIKDVYVFKMNDFKFFMEENRVDNSYTQYKNRIGLTDGKRFLSDSGDVVLDFPYKDCVLAGGQSTEEGEDIFFEYEEEKTRTVKGEKVTEPAGYKEKKAKRKEIFFNQILAKDEIDRLFDPKALVNWKRYTQNGEEEVRELRRDESGTIKENLIIKGNNLLALHSLKKQFAGKVKLIYIDPPYNREEDKSTFYNDNFNHSTWLTFLSNRITIAKELLRETGLIFISIDDNEAAYLKVLADSIFGEDNFLASIAYERSGVSGLGQGGSFLVNTHESILCYAKNKVQMKVYDLNGEYDFGHKDMKRYNKILKSIGAGKEVNKFTASSTNEDVIIYKHDDFEFETISLANFSKNKSNIIKQYEDNFENVFRNTSIQAENEFQNKILDLCQDGLYSAYYLVSRGKNKGKWITAYYYNGQVFAWLKDTAKKTNDGIKKTNKLSDFWSHGSIPKADLANEGGVKLRRGKKPENLLKRILQISTTKDDIVLDFFTGSGTTAAVAHKMGRQYIGIEQLDYGENDSVVRLQNVISGEQSGISKSVDWKGGGSFIYLELAQWNENAKAEILACESLADLEKLFERLYETYFLNYNLKIKEFKEKVMQEENFKALSLDEQKKIFLAMLDLNQLYVQESEMADRRFGISEKDQALTKAFYNGE